MSWAIVRLYHRALICGFSRCPGRLWKGFAWGATPPISSLRIGMVYLNNLPHRIKMLQGRNQHENTLFTRRYQANNGFGPFNEGVKNHRLVAHFISKNIIFTTHGIPPWGWYFDAPGKARPARRTRVPARLRGQSPRIRRNGCARSVDRTKAHYTRGQSLSRYSSGLRLSLAVTNLYSGTKSSSSAKFGSGIFSVQPSPLVDPA